MMDQNRKDELDALFERTLRDFVAGENPPERVWTNIRARVQEPRQQTQSRFGYLRHLGTEVMSWGSDVGTTVQIILASLYIRGNGEGWTERLVVTGHSTVPLHYSIHH
jgi:hypothetical protein